MVGDCEFLNKNEMDEGPGPVENDPKIDFSVDHVSEDEDAVTPSRMKTKRRMRILAESSDDDDPVVSTQSPSKVGKPRRVLSDDSDENEDDISKEMSMTGLGSAENVGKKKSRVIKIFEDSDDQDNATSQPSQTGSDEADVEKSIKNTVNDDLFDAEMEDEVNEGGDEGSDEEGQRSDDVEGNEGEMSAALRKRLAKGAAKKPREKRQAAVKARQHNLKEIHSETQRLVRESSLKLPYHQPQPRDLSVFLARTRQKQEQLSANTRDQRLPWKQAPDPSLFPSKSPSPSKPSASHWISPSPDKASSSQAVLPAQDGANVTDITENGICDTGGNSEIRDVSSPTVVLLASGAEENTTASKPEVNLFIGPDDEEEVLTQGRVSSSCDGKENADCVNPIEADQRTIPSTLLTPKLQQLEVVNMKPVLGGGAASEFIDLDAEGEDEGRKVDSGLDVLVERLVKHTVVTTTKPAKDVTINTVVKERVEGGGTEQEELRLDTMTYRIEAEQQPPNSLLHKPGAKLAALKVHLQGHMRVRRNQAREERMRVFRLDNEEGGYEGCRLEEDQVLDNEGELTDQTDTDGEEDEEEEGWEEYGVGEKVRASNLFVDEEADEDDDDYDPENDDEETGREAESDEDDAADDEEEDGLHLKLDTCNAMDEEEEEEFQESNNILHISKHKSVDLFSEDAFTESPSGSQESHPDSVTELSERPFEQLSGETVILAEESSGLLKRDVSSNPVKPIMTDDTDISMTSSLVKDASFGADSLLDMIPAGQAMSAKHFSNQSLTSDDRSTPDLFSPSTKSKLGKSKNSSSLFLPIEDSQDLLNNSSLSTQSDVATLTSSQSNFHFTELEDDTQSQMLDADGLFKSRSGSDKSLGVRSKALLAMNNSVPESLNAGDSSNMDELLGLCSGQFSAGGTQAGPQKQLPGTQVNMDELLGLCSGRFTDPSQKTETGRIMVGGDSAGEGQQMGTEAGEGSPNMVTSSQRKKKHRRRVISEEESDDSLTIVSGDGGHDSDNDSRVGLDSDEEVGPEEGAPVALRDAHGKLRRDFVDEEAELSGSEIGSDEDLDLDEDEDVLETEAGDADDVGSHQQLHDQVNRIHLKNIIDSDKRDIRLLQEMYLPDGDMYSDKTRTRRFRWANVDEDDTQQDMFKEWEEEVVDEEEGEAEKQWRLERHQRELFLHQSKGEEEDKDALIKLGNVIFKQQQQQSQSRPVPLSQDVKNKPEALIISEKEALSEKKLLAKSPGVFKVPKLGSFLSKGKDTLAKIAELTKPSTGNVGGGPRGSRNFVFAAKSPEAASDAKPQMKRSLSVDPASSPTSSQPAPKRPRIMRSNTTPAKSIFHLLEKSHAS